MYFFVTMAYIHTDLPKPKNNFTYNTTKKKIKNLLGLSTF